ncbi:MAG: peptidoglycan DD-metalloendopeptidase family protein [Ferruginibacter sp.]
MIKFRFVIVSLFFLFSIQLQAQTREALEKQRQQLKKEIEQTEKQLNNNKLKTKENLLQWKLINNKVNLQDRVIDNINRDLNVLNNDIYTIQKDINKFDRLLDTLKQEYAKSMIYAYKNRGSYEFLNFIFSSSNFNDAIKRIAYLKSYRNHREMQGENIQRTQELKRQRVEDLGGTKMKKRDALLTQNKEMKTLEQQQKEKDKMLADLKKQSKNLNNQIAAKQKQMQKVSNAIAAAIRRAQEEARKEALAKAAEEERRRVAAEKSVEKNNSALPGATVKPSTTPSRPPPKIKKPGESVLLNSENIALNSSFERNKGSLPWPVDRGTVLMHYGNNTMPSGTTINVTSVTISADIGSPVKAVFDGIVSTVQTVEDMQVVIIQHGRYFSTYSNLSGVNIQRGQQVKTGQSIGRVAANFDGIGAIDFFMSNEKSNYDPEAWLRRR